LHNDVYFRDLIVILDDATNEIYYVYRVGLDEPGDMTGASQLLSPGLRSLRRFAATSQKANRN